MSFGTFRFVSKRKRFELEQNVPFFDVVMVVKCKLQLLVSGGGFCVAFIFGRAIVIRRN